MGAFDDYHFLVGKRVYGKKSKNHWENIYDDLQITRPAVIALGGGRTNDSRKANGYAKLVESMLGGFSQDVDIFAVDYNSNIFSLQPLEACIQKLAKEIFLPLISKNGSRIELEEACKNMRKVTFFTHCFGYDTIMLGMQEVLFNLLSNLGYSQDESAKIVEQLFVISFGADPQNGFYDLGNREWFKSVNVVSPFDETYLYISNGTEVWEKLAKNGLDAEKFMTNADKQELKRLAELGEGRSKEIRKFCDNNPRCFVLRNDNRISLATSRLKLTPKDEEYYINYDEHDMEEFRFDKDWKPGKDLTAVGEKAAECLAVSLCTAVANSILNEQSPTLVPVDMQEIEQTLNGIVYAFNTQSTVAERGSE